MGILHGSSLRVRIGFTDDGLVLQVSIGSFTDMEYGFFFCMF